MELFGKEAITPLFAVERAHRTPPRPLLPGNQPRSMLAYMLNYRDHKIILRLAREKANIQYNGVGVSFYPDFSAEVQHRRTKFQVMKKPLLCL